MSYFTGFNEILNVEADGGKGNNLKQLVAMGFNVPEGIVIGSSFYKKHYPFPPDFDFQNEQLLEAQCKEMIWKIEEISLPKNFMDELKQELTSFGHEVRFAVRSSSTYEDLSSSAFAGQHDTYLNVPIQELEAKIRKCFASLWQKHAVLYRMHRGFDQRNATMAVVIQKMIPAETAGVAFSVNPVNGDLSQALIEANFGVGESVVGGEAATDSWVVDTSNLTVVERRINEKEHCIVASEIGTEVKELQSEDRNKPCLSDIQIIEVTKKVKQIEQDFGSPQDVEWAFMNSTLYILQSRPQTIIPPCFTRDESAERYPDPLTPLTWSYAEEAFNNSLEYSLKMMDINLPTRPWFAMKDCYIYGNQNAVKLLSTYRLFDMKSVADLAGRLPVILDRIAWVFDLPNLWMRDLEKYLINIGELRAVSFDSFNIEDFHSYFKKVFVVANDYFKPNIAISMTQAFLTKALYEVIAMLTGDPNKALLKLKQITATSGTKTGQINREIYGMAVKARENKELFDLLAQGSSNALKSLHLFEEFESKFNEFIENYGHRETTFDYYKPTWVDAPWVVLDLIYLAASSGQRTEPEEREKQIKVQSFEATQQLIAETPSELRYFISELIRLTNTYTYLDDLEHFQTTRINVLARRVAGAFGAKLVDANQLEDKFDVFFLTKEEIESVKSFELPDEIKSNIITRKKEYLEACSREPIWDLNQVSDAIEDETDFLKGVPGSPGECEGEAYLVRGPEDFAGVPDNSIIVARTTNPAWTPLFYKAKGLITESGGPLSHGAVTARELGLPAVMCVRNALKIFKNNEKVRIDGKKGIVFKI